MSEMPTREELEEQIATLEEELREREAALPIHSVRPAQFQAIEELEERIRAKGEVLKNLKDHGNDDIKFG
jgi:hypothetical protein